MAVETRYVVIRTNKQHEETEVMTFTDKRSADEYDRMLDMADAMYDILQQGEIELSEQQCDELSILLAKQREEVLVALQAKKKTSASKKSKPSTEKQKDMLDKDEGEISAKSLSETLMASDKIKQSEDENGNLVDFVIEKDDAA